MSLVLSGGGWRLQEVEDGEGPAVSDSEEAGEEDRDFGREEEPAAEAEIVDESATVETAAENGEASDVDNDEEEGFGWDRNSE